MKFKFFQKEQVIKDRWAKWAIEYAINHVMLIYVDETSIRNYSMSMGPCDYTVSQLDKLGEEHYMGVIFETNQITFEQFVHDFVYDHGAILISTEPWIES